MLLGAVSFPAADFGAIAFGPGTSGATAPSPNPASPGPGVGRPPPKAPVLPPAPPSSVQPQPFEGGTYLVIEAVPAHADVFLNDRLIGRADQVAAWLIPVIPGTQTITIQAAGFRPFSARVATRPIGTPTRVRVSLERE